MPLLAAPAALVERHPRRGRMLSRSLSPSFQFSRHFIPGDPAVAVCPPQDDRPNHQLQRAPATTLSGVAPRSCAGRGVESRQLFETKLAGRRPSAPRARRDRRYTQISRLAELSYAATLSASDAAAEMLQREHSDDTRVLCDHVPPASIRRRTDRRSTARPTFQRRSGSRDTPIASALHELEGWRPASVVSMSDRARLEAPRRCVAARYAAARYCPRRPLRRSMQSGRIDAIADNRGHSSIRSSCRLRCSGYDQKSA